MSDPITDALKAAGVPTSKNGSHKRIKPEDQPVILPDVKSGELEAIQGIDDLMKPVNLAPPQSNALDKALAEETRERLEMAKQFMASQLQKTELTASERKLVPLLRIMARSPFGSRKPRFQHRELSEWVKEYIEFGIAVNRKGRSEEVAVLKGMFGQNIEYDQEGGLTGRLRALGK